MKITQRTRTDLVHIVHYLVLLFNGMFEASYVSHTHNSLWTGFDDDLDGSMHHQNIPRTREPRW